MRLLFTRPGASRLFALAIMALILGMLAGSPGVLAAEAGGLRVTITNADGSPIAGATVKASSPSSLVSVTEVTSDDGIAILRGLPAGEDYTVSVAADSYPGFTAPNVAVVSNQQLSLQYALGAETQTLDTIVVTGQSLAAIDTTSPTLMTVLNLGVTESVPTGRSYQSYLELVPSVKPSSSGNPASRSGVNYANIGGQFGSSTDNVYILDGINVTDPLTGTFGSNINSEIIKQQVVLTGGVPAKYPGGTGLVSRVITKSGSNDFHGSLNYYFQNDSLVGHNKHGNADDFSTYDTALTFGGPIVEDKLWFFLSYQKKHRSQTVVDPATDEEMRTVKRDGKLGFFKATYQITDNDRLQASFFNDPTTISGSTNPNTPNQADRSTKQGGDNYRLSYSHRWDHFDLGLFGYKHKAQLAQTPSNLETANTVAYLTGNPSSTDVTRGGYGSESDSWRDRRQFGLTGSFWVDTSWGMHEVEFGYTDTQDKAKFATAYTGPDDSQYSSIALQDAGVTLRKYMDSSVVWTGERNLITSDVARILDAIADSSNQAYFIDLLDANGDGTISPEELLDYRLTATEGNPDGQVNAYRIKLAKQNPYNVTTKGKAFYLQDTWTLGNWAVEAGVRAEQWGHYASNGEEIFTFDWEYAPRLSVIWDPSGNGTSKLWAYYGRYYDPIRNNMTDFAGALTGNVTHEQIYLGDEWLTYRVRGGSTQRDAAFVPTTKTPYTDEFMLGYAITLTENMSLKLVADYRKTKNLLEDFDMSLYTNYGNEGVPPEDRPGQAAPGTGYFLPYEYYGYDGGFPPGINYFIGTLPGGKREYKGLTATLTKYRANNWLGVLSYTYNHFQGNSNSDSNADFQGDWIALDPRAPNRWGQMPGNIHHQVMAYGSYFFDNGLEVGGVFHWNSGYAYSKTFSLYGRHLPVMGPYEVKDGVYDSWILPNSVGSETAPSYWTFDVRLKYNWELPVGKMEFFLDVFNVLDNQATTHVMDLVGGTGTYDFQDGTEWVRPRRLYLGARYSF